MKNEKKELMELIKQVELLDENSSGQLAGGFTSLSFKQQAVLAVGDVNVGRCGDNTNCAGGNCVAGCGGPPAI